MSKIPYSKLRAFLLICFSLAFGLASEAEFSLVSPAPLFAQSLSFERALPGRTLQFPRDHGNHPTFETEWWYFTGHLFDEQGQPFKDASRQGFQLTFFRRAKKAEEQSPNSGDAASWNQVYLAHAALSDFVRPQFLFSKRISSGALGVAGAASFGLKAWNRDWKAEMMGDSVVLEFSLPAKENEGKAPETKESEPEVRLVGKIIEAPVLQGEAGLSKKGVCEGCASFYYSVPRLELTGHIRRGESISKVHGIGWMDHEFMSNALGKDQVGWDWFSLNTKDGASVMLFQLRNKKGDIDFSSGTLVRRIPGRADLQVSMLKPEDFSIDVLSTWESAKSKGRYPSHWRVRVPKAELDVEILPKLADQELVSKGGAVGDVAYWEGAVSSSDNAVIGYVEMTGYAGEMGEIL